MHLSVRPCVFVCVCRAWLGGSVNVRICFGNVAHVCPHCPLFPHTPGFFLRVSPVMCHAVDCRRVCMRAWVRVWASRIRSSLVVHDVVFRLPSTSCHDDVFPETYRRDHVTDTHHDTWTQRRSENDVVSATVLRDVKQVHRGSY